MKTKKKIEVKVSEVTCDFCDVSSVYFHGTTHRYNVTVEGGKHINTCQICKKDVCKKHSAIFSDSYTDNDGYTHWNSIITCLNCKPVVEKIWEEEKEKDPCAEECGALVFRVEKRLKEKNNES